VRIAYANANGHAHSDPNGHANSDSNGDADRDSDGDTDSASYANPECTTSADARTQRDASGHAAASTLRAGHNPRRFAGTREFRECLRLRAVAATLGLYARWRRSVGDAPTMLAGNVWRAQPDDSASTSDSVTATTVIEFFSCSFNPSEKPTLSQSSILP
jgi:hypothetical protein